MRRTCRPAVADVHPVLEAAVRKRVIPRRGAGYDLIHHDAGPSVVPGGAHGVVAVVSLARLGEGDRRDALEPVREAVAALEQYLGCREVETRNLGG